jgi:hypothetical protein
VMRMMGRGLGIFYEVRNWALLALRYLSSDTYAKRAGVVWESFNSLEIIPSVKQGYPKWSSNRVHLTPVPRDLENKSSSVVPDGCDIKCSSCQLKNQDILVDLG